MTPTQAKSLVKSYAMEIAAAVAVLGAAGWITISPKEQIEHVSTRLDKVVQAQAVRDSLQDVRAYLMERTLRSVESLVQVQCLTTRDALARQILECRPK